MSSSAQPNLDPYTAKAEKNNVSPQEKIRDLHEIVKSVEVGMLTTRSSSGQMHSRAMTPSSPHDELQTDLLFFANNVSHKFDEIEHDSHANVSFYNSSTTSWASYSGTAKVSQDKELIKKHWSPVLSAYFGDLGDGVHKGDQNDPRVSMIQIIPSEIRYWVATKGKAGRALETGLSTISKGVSAPGELRTITPEEIQLAQGLKQK